VLHSATGDAAATASGVKDADAHPGVAAGVYSPPVLYSVSERLLCATILIVLSPLILVLLVLIRIESPGSPLFVQDRIAVGAKRPFRFAKLRTMYADSRRRFPELYDFSFSGKAAGEIMLQLAEDPRVTPIGRFLRRTSLDELPNLWHVVTGDMRLVGPRPELWEMLPHYDAQTMRKFAVKPGVTGYAQIRGRGDLNFADTVALDLRYVDEASLSTDLRCLKDTFAAVFLRRGAH
jgi:lipopolysaccharide/colanic/teichoic acid biosynthesis glycosyltransferase